MATSISGLLAQFQATPNDLVGEWQDTIFVRNAKGMNNGSTLFGLMSRLENEGSKNIEYNWWEREPARTEIYVAAIVASGTTSFSSGQLLDQLGGVDASPLLADGHVLYLVRTAEYMLVVGDPAASVVTVVRGFSGTAAATAVGDFLIITTLGKADGAIASHASYEQPEVKTNYVQTFNSVVELANAYMGSELRTDIEGPLNDNRAQALERIANQIEIAYFLGVKKKRTEASGTNYRYFTGGIADALNTAALSNNILNGLGGTGVALAVFNTWVQSYMTLGSDMKLAFCGPSAYAAISNYANSAANGYRILQNESVFGMNVTSINTPFGELNLVFHPLFKKATTLQGHMFVVDLAHIVQKTFEPLFLEPNIQLPGQDSYKEQYRAKLGLKMKFIESFGYAYNLTKIV